MPPFLLKLNLIDLFHLNFHKTCYGNSHIGLLPSVSIMKFSINQLTPINKTILFVAFFSVISLPVNSAAISVRAGQYEQNLVLGENQTDISPTGYDLSVNFDFTENLVVHLDYGAYDKDKSFLLNNTLDYEKDTWGLGASYYLGDWSFSAQYSDLDERLTITNDRHSALVYEEDYRSPAYMLSVGYNFDLQTNNAVWFFNLSSALQSSDWRLNLKRVERPIENEQFNTGVDKGDTLFGDISFSAARFINLSDNHTVYVGGSIGWNHLISGESSIISRNGVSVQQLARTRSTSQNRANQASFSQSVQGDQYGLLSLFIAYSLTENLSLDFDYSTSFSADENSEGAYITLGYSW